MSDEARLSQPPSKPLATNLDAGTWLAALFWTVLSGLFLSNQFAWLVKTPAILLHAKPSGLAMFCVMYLLFVYVRGARFRALIDPESSALHGILVGGLYTAGCTVAPGGIGELSLPLTYYQTRRIPVSVSIAALLVSRLLDVVSLAIIFFCATMLGVVRGLPGFLHPAIWLAGIAAVSALVLVLTLGRLGAGRLAPRGRSSRVRRFLADVVRAVASVRPAALRQATLQTGLLRVAGLGMYVFLLSSFGLDLSWWQVTAAAALNSLFRVLPIQGLGGFGTQEAWWTLSLGAVGVPAGIALAYAVGVHLVVLTISLMLGIAAAAMLFTGRNLAGSAGPTS